MDVGGNGKILYFSELFTLPPIPVLCFFLTGRWKSSLLFLLLFPFGQSLLKLLHQLPTLLPSNISLRHNSEIYFKSPARKKGVEIRASLFQRHPPALALDLSVSYLESSKPLTQLPSVSIRYFLTQTHIYTWREL